MPLSVPPSPSGHSLEFSRTVPPSPSVKSQAPPSTEDRRLQAIRDYDERKRQQALQEQRALEEAANLQALVTTNARVKLLDHYLKIIQNYPDETNPFYEQLVELLKNPVQSGFPIWNYEYGVVKWNGKYTDNGAAYVPVKLLSNELPYHELSRVSGSSGDRYDLKIKPVVCGVVEIHSPNSIFHTCFLSLVLRSVKSYDYDYSYDNNVITGVITVVLTLQDPRLPTSVAASNLRKTKRSCVIL